MTLKEWFIDNALDINNMAVEEADKRSEFNPFRWWLIVFVWASNTLIGLYWFRDAVRFIGK